MSMGPAHPRRSANGANDCAADSIAVAVIRMDAVVVGDNRGAVMGAVLGPIDCLARQGTGNAADHRAHNGADPGNHASDHGARDRA